MGEWLGAHDACMMIGDASFRSTLDASLHPTLQNLHPLPPFALRPNKAYRLNPDLVDPEPQSPPAADSKDSIPTRLYRRPSARRKKKPTTITPPSCPVDQSVHTSKTTSIVSPSSLYCACALRQSTAPKTHSNTNTRLHSPYTETRLRVHHPPTLHQTHLQTDFSERQHDKRVRRT